MQLLKKQIYFISGMALMLFCGIKWSLHLSSNMDILFGDEAEYMRNGLDLFKIIRNDWGPAYNIWYKFLSFFQNDTIQLYYLNYALGAILIGVLFFVFLYQHIKQKQVALYVGFCFLVSSININTWPRVSHFVIIILLISLILASHTSSKAKKWLIYSIACFICAYARPDLMLSFFCCVPVTFYFIWKEKKSIRSFLPYLFVLLAVVLFFQFVFGQPSATYKGGLDRLYSAFCQHYAMNYKMMHKDGFDAITEWINFSKQQFPNSHTLKDVILNQPGLFFQNLLLNCKNYLMILLLTVTSFVFPTGIFKSKKVLFLSVFILFLLVVIVFANKKYRDQFFVKLQDNKQLLLFLFIFGVPSLGMSIVIFPRMHYVLLHIILLAFIITLLLDAIALKINMQWSYWLFFLLFIVISPKSSSYAYMQFGSDMKNLCEQKLIRFLEKDKAHPHVVMTNYLNVTYLLPKNYSEFSTEFELKEGMSFKQLLEEKKIDIILVSINIVKNPILLKDATWNEFMLNPEQFGFHKVKYNNECESYFLIKQ